MGNNGHHTHTCKTCQLLGQVKYYHTNYDIYNCNGVVLIRWDSEPAAYLCQADWPVPEIVYGYHVHRSGSILNAVYDKAVKMGWVT